MYGPADSPKKFYIYLKKILKELGWIEIIECIHVMKNKEGEINGLIYIHVDDMFIACHPDVENKIESDIMNKIEIEEFMNLKDEEIHEYAGICIQYNKNKNQLYISQENYRKNIEYIYENSNKNFN